MGDLDGMFGGRPPRLLIRTLKASAALAGLAFLAAHLATNGFERGEATRLAAAFRGPAPDPVTTGSITAARGTRLDPCVVLKP